ncbi:MAG: hypothetical protein ACRC5C_04575, partial [Bacilli bacterium]
MFRNSMTHSAMEVLGEEMAEWVAPRLLRDEGLVTSAYNLYREGQIYNARRDRKYVMANVYDSVYETEHEVIFHLNELKESSCTCERITPCTHMLAAFFYIYNAYFPIGNWRKKLQREQVSSLGSLGVQRGVDGLVHRREVNERPAHTASYGNLIRDARKVDEQPLEIVGPKEWADSVSGHIEAARLQTSHHSAYSGVQFIRDLAQHVPFTIEVRNRETLSKRPAYHLITHAKLISAVAETVHTFRQEDYFLNMADTTKQMMIHSFADIVERPIMRKQPL